MRLVPRHFHKEKPVERLHFTNIDGIEPSDYEDLAQDLYNRSAGLHKPTLRKRKAITPVNERQVFSEIRRQINKNNLINSCSGEGCTVDMEGVPSERIIVHVENEFDFQEKREKKV